MTVKEYLESAEFEKEYGPTGHGYSIVDEAGISLDHFFDFDKEEEWEKFISTHQVHQVQSRKRMGPDGKIQPYAEIMARHWR